MYLHLTRPQIGAAEYRKLRWEGKTTLPKPVVLPEGVNGSLPSSDSRREIPYRVFTPESGVSKGIHMHIHGGGWVLMSEAQYVPDFFPFPV
jgi:acetyl esterase/lipase